MRRFWMTGTRSAGELHPEVAAGDHDAVGLGEDLGKALDRARLLDLPP
jgi:hypothetical protein